MGSQQHPAQSQHEQEDAETSQRKRLSGTSCVVWFESDDDVVCPVYKKARATCCVRPWVYTLALDRTSFDMGEATV